MCCGIVGVPLSEEDTTSSGYEDGDACDDKRESNSSRASAFDG